MPSVLRTPPKSLRSISAAHSVSYFFSPLQKATLNSPIQKHKKPNDDKILIEKKKLESRLQQKEFLIYDLQDQVREKSDKLEELNNNLEELKRKYVKAQHFEHKAFEYDILEEKYSIIEKEKVYLEEKCKKYIKDLDDLKILRAANEKLENEIAELTHENTLMETRENYNQIELQRLRSVDADLSSMTKSNQKKEDKG